ncbi:MAG: hypothetical protein Q7J05_05790 [Paludibacter sp.]|nr:hypothetical protein [Paludibacter sp.]
MRKKITKLTFIVYLLFLGIFSSSAQVEVTLFHETFNKMTTTNTTGNGLTGGNADETGYVVGGAPSSMLCSENGTMNITGGRFATRNMDLSGNNVKLYVTYKLIGATTKKFQIDIDKTGTSGMGGILNEAGGDSPTTFTTKTFNVTGGTVASYIHLRTESSHTIVLDEIKITHEVASLTPSVALTAGKNPASAMETVAMEPVVFTYSNVANANNVVYNWYTDNTYIATTTAPANLSISKDTDAKTVTVSGTPTTGTAGTYYYKLGVNEPNGNEIQGRIVVSAFVASSDKDISNLQVNGMTPTFNAETNTYSLVIPKLASLTQAVTFDIPATATANFTSGNAYDFTNPLSITVTAQDDSQKIFTVTIFNGIADIAYVVNTAISTNDTKVYPMLKSKGYYLGVIPATGSDLTQFNAYDLFVLNEETNSANSLLAAMGQLIGVKPLLNFKAYMYSRTNWPTGAGYNGASDISVLVEEAYLQHPVFDGVTIAENLLQILNTGISGNGIQSVTNPGSGNIIAKLPSRTADVTMIEENEVATAKYLLIPIANANYANVSDNGLKLIENAVNYLLSDDKYIITGNNQLQASRIFFDGHKIKNQDGELMKVYDTTGRLVVSSSEDIQLISFNRGVYIIRSEKGGILKIVY